MQRGEWGTMVESDLPFNRHTAHKLMQIANHCVRTLADSDAFRAVGPFYSLSDKPVYLDTAYFGEIESRLHGCQGNACQFTQAYVVAHEVGHHGQNLLGVTGPRG